MKLQTEIDLPINTRNAPPEPNGLKQTIAEFMHELAPWDIFFTGTFKGSYSEAQTQRAFEKFMQRSFSGVTYFYVIEHNPSREGHHVHALLYSADPIWREEMNQTWFQRFGYAKVEKIRSRTDVENYCTKHVRNYLTKGGGWWNYQINDSLLFQKRSDMIE